MTPIPYMECPHPPGTEDYALWWEARHKITIARLNAERDRHQATEKALRKVEHGHKFCFRDLRCRQCGMQRRDYVVQVWKAAGIGDPVPVCTGAG